MRRKVDTFIQSPFRKSVFLRTATLTPGAHANFIDLERLKMNRNSGAPSPYSSRSDTGTWLPHSTVLTRLGLGMSPPHYIGTPILDDSGIETGNF